MTSPAVGRTRRPLGRLVASILWACAAPAVLVLVCADGPDTDLLASGGAAGAVERSSQAAGDVVSIPDGGRRPGPFRVRLPGRGGRRRWHRRRPRFTDDPLVPGVTPVRAVHLLELRARIDGLRARAGLPAFAWTDPEIVPGVTPGRAAHLTGLRSALAAAYAAAGRASPAYTDAEVTAGATAIRAVHLQELRSAVVALEGSP